jgi:metal-sulfur cluster biosynthetic enzyme
MPSVYREYEELTRGLGQDVSKALIRMEDEDTQTNRRIFIRSFFAMVEGELYALKQIILKRHESSKSDLSMADVAMLKEETYSLKNSGKPHIRPQYVGTKENLKFVVRKIREVYDTEVDLEWNEAWQSFTNAIKIRNRITHPKSVDELTISDHERNNVRKAFGWYNANIGELLNSTGHFHVSHV